MNLNKTNGAVSVSLHSGLALTVYYDGACPVCSREIAMYRRQSGAEQCVWVDASSCPEADLGNGLSRASALARFHIRRADGELVDGMRGFAALWRSLPRFAWAGRVASVGSIALLLDVAYRVFLWVRPAWQLLRTVSPQLGEIPGSERKPALKRTDPLGHAPRHTAHTNPESDYSSPPRRH